MFSNRRVAQLVEHFSCIGEIGVRSPVVTHLSQKVTVLGKVTCPRRCTCRVALSRNNNETECELLSRRINLYDQQNTSPPSIGSANQQFTLGSTGEIIATSSEILNVRPVPAKKQQSPNQIMNIQIRDGVPALSPNFHQQPQFFLPQFPVPVLPVQYILADIHKKLSKLNCLDDILAKLSNLETKFSNMEQTVHKSLNAKIIQKP